MGRSSAGAAAGGIARTGYAQADEPDVTAGALRIVMRSVTDAASDARPVTFVIRPTCTCGRFPIVETHENGVGDVILLTNAWPVPVQVLAL